MTLPLSSQPEQPPPRMTSALPSGHTALEKGIPISPGEIPEVTRFLEKLRAEKAMQGGGGNQVIAGITNEFMKRQLKLIRARIEGLAPPGTVMTGPELMEVQRSTLAIIDEHIQALE